MVRAESVRFVSFSAWHEALLELGFKAIQDVYRDNIFLALDKQGFVVGAFVADHALFEGFLFPDYETRQRFEQGL